MDGGSTENSKSNGSFPDLANLAGWWTNSRMAAWIFVFCGSVLLNSTLLVAFVRRPGLRTISNRFVMNLIASNILSILVLSGLLLNNNKLPIDSIENSSIPGLPSLCGIAEGATVLVTTSSILSVLLIGVDQYLAVVDPLRYRTRIDKLKCALLILGVWILALVFGVLASFNPEPRTLCSISYDNEEETQSLALRAKVFLDDINDTDLEIDGVLDVRPNKDIKTDVGSSTNPAEIYGTVFAVTYAILGYLVPFIAICLIYISIYLAARNNSERTRRTGSRPILSSGSFSEESSCAQKASYEDIRPGKMPKRSSLSSIDERSEATQSQLAYQDNLEVEPQAVVFTLGNSRLEIEDESKRTQAKDNDQQQSKVPISALKAQFLTSEQPHSTELSRSKFPEVSDQRRKSSHDLLYDDPLPDKHLYHYDDDEAEDHDEHYSDEEAIDISNLHHHHHQHLHHHHHRLDSEEALPLSDDHRVNDHHSEDGSKLNSFSQSLPLPPIVTITPPGHKSSSSLHRAPSASRTNISHGYINNIKHKISNGSLFKYREETRAARISVLVVFMGFICWTPYVFLLVERNLPHEFLRLEENPNSILKMDTIALSFLVLATYLSPLLFGYRSRRIKRELRKFFCFKRELSYKNNRSLMAKKVIRRRHSGATILDGLDTSRYNIFNCIHSNRNKWPKDKVQFVQVPDTALAVETCRSSFSSGASTQISSTSTDEC